MGVGIRLLSKLVAIAVVAGAVLLGLSSVRASAADTGSFDLAVYVESWAIVPGEQNVSAVWRVENHGPATTVDAQAILSQPSSLSVPFDGRTVPPLASGATFTFTMATSVADTSHFVLQMHVRIAGQIDSNTSNDDALITVGYGNASGGGSGGAGAAPVPVIPVTVQALQPVFRVTAPVGRCTSDGPPNTSLYTIGGVPSKAILTVLLPDGSTFNGWPPANGRPLPVGTSHATISAWNAVDPSPVATATFDVIVTDAQSPRLVMPQRRTITATASGSRGAHVSFTIPRTVDNCPGVRVTARPKPGSLFRIGTTTVRLTAVDASGNTSTATMKVIVMKTPQQR